MIPAASFIRLFVTTLAAVLGIVALFNFVVDPYDISRILSVSRLNGQKPAELQRARLRKPLDLWRQHYDGIALGTSQVEMGMDTDNPSLSMRGINLYNAGISEERPFEQALLLGHAAETSGIKFALVSLDFLRYVGGGGRPEFLARDWTRWHGAADYIKSLISASSLHDSLMTIAASWTNMPTMKYLPRGWFNMEEYFAVKGPLDSRTEFDQVDAAYLNGVYQPILERQIELARSGFDHTAVRDMMATARQHGIALRFFIPPSHARQAEIITFLGIEPLFEQWESELACLLAQEAAADPNRRPFPIWDFSGYNSVTTEAIPPLHSKLPMRWYYDSVHFSSRTGRAIQDRLLGLPSDDLGDMEDFGNKLTPSAMSAHFEERDQDRSRYLTMHPEVSGEIAALYRGPPLRTSREERFLPLPCSFRERAAFGTGAGAVPF